MSKDTRPCDYAKHHALLMDALSCFWCEAPARRPAIIECWKDLHEWHNHDQEDEDEHCDSNCPAWFPGAYCSNCGARHRKPVANGGAK